ncbi:LysR family transcriptional regulator [Yoonia sp. BS5-3]|uniref:LysR family transcriptional regulator n=1 Tax=Yoonia phaeophyticola TaxID=3137369 RepID=A0ABZ2V415_9RHOB
MEPHWDDLQTVLCLVRCGSLAGAAAELGVNYTTVSRRITRAETALGVALFDRLTDGYRPTEAGQTVATFAARMELDAHALIRQLHGLNDSLSGPLTITAPQLLIAHVLGPVIDQFCTAYPDVRLHVRATNDLLDLNRRQADLAIRISRDPGDTLMGLRLTAQHSASFAHADWAAQIAEDPQKMIDWLVYAAYNSVPGQVDPQYPHHRVRMTFDDMVAIQGAAQAGLGVARMPMFLGRACGLTQVPVLPPQPYADIWVVGHRDVWPSAKVKAFRDILIPYFRQTKDRFTAG